MPTQSAIASTAEIVAELKAGRMVILVDEDRENEGDLVMAAEHITPETATLWPNTWPWFDLLNAD